MGRKKTYINPGFGVYIPNTQNGRNFARHIDISVYAHTHFIFGYRCMLGVYSTPKSYNKDTTNKRHHQI